MTFRDNAKGYRSGPNNADGDKGNPAYSWAYGYQVNAFYHDLYQDKKDNVYKNRPDDNTRVSITTAVNFGAAAGQDTAGLSESDRKKLEQKGADEADWIIQMQSKEFLSVDDS